MGRKFTEAEWNNHFYNAYKILEANSLKENAPYISMKDLSEKIGVACTGFRDALKRQGAYRGPKTLMQDIGNYLKIEQFEKVKEATLVFADKKKADDVNWRDFSDLAETNQSMQKRLETSQRIANVEIKTKSPIAIMFTSDWHLGDSHTDHATWRQDIEFLLGTPNLYMIDLGDDRQNARKFYVLSMVLNQVLSPRQQALMMKDLIDELTRDDKLLAKIGGNHDEEWDEKIFGEAMQSYLTAKMKAPRFRNRGLIKLTVGEQLYTLLVFHKSRFKSFLRKAHGAMREQQLSYPADIVAGGHNHEPGMEHFHHYRLAAEADMGFGGETYLIKTGTYQDSDYGWKYFHNGGFPTNYTVVLWPDQKKMLVFQDPKDAVHYMNSL